MEKQYVWFIVEETSYYGPFSTIDRALKSITEDEEDEDELAQINPDEEQQAIYAHGDFPFLRRVLIDAEFHPGYQIGDDCMER